MAWTTRRISLMAVFGLVIAGYMLPAEAQWAWRDESGRTVYSDRPPPPNIKSDQILRQGTQTFGNADQASDAKGDAKDPKAPKSLAEREMEFRKRMQESADAEKKAAETQARNDQKAAECERMRGYLRALQEGQRIARTDAQGNREILDDAQRANEVRRVQEGLSNTCS